MLKLFLIGLSDFSGSIESKLFLEWTWALKASFNNVKSEFLWTALRVTSVYDMV